MRVGSLCTGYGGIELGLALAGVDVDLRWFAEIDQDVATIVDKHDTGAPNLGDITRADWSRVGPVDLLTAGFPCQPVSAAGKRQGAADPRWLWNHVARAVAALRPDRLLIENVRNLISYDGGSLWAGALNDLNALGYGVRWLTLGACHVGAAHHRHRVFAVATLGGAGVERVPTTTCGLRGGMLLPTPTARDGDGRGEGDAEYWAAKRRTNGIPLGAELALLPTPTVNDSRGGRNATAVRSEGRDHHHAGTTLCDVAYASMWGRFAEAVARHEALYGPAPAPTEPNRNGAPRLAAPFAEWLMCLPAGHVTDVLARVPALRAIGNGVCPPQLAAAWALLTGRLLNER